MVLKRMSPRAERILWLVVAALLVLAMAANCWAHITQTLGAPLDARLEYGGDANLERVTGGTAHASMTGIVTVGVQLTHVSSQLQWLVALSIANQNLLTTLVILAFGVVWIRTRAGRPFARSVTVSLTALAVVVAVFGTLEEVLDSWIAAREAYEAVGGGEFARYYDGSGFTISGLSILIAVAIGVLASAFAIGARLSKETEGLV